MKKDKPELPKEIIDMMPLGFGHILVTVKVKPPESNPKPAIFWRFGGLSVVEREKGFFLNTSGGVKKL